MEIVATIFRVIWIAVQAIVAFYVLLPTALLIIYGFKKLFRWSSAPILNAYSKKDATNFAAIIAAHSDFTLVPPLVDSLLKQQYSKFKVYIVADNIKDPQLPVQDPRIKLIVPEIPFNDKTKSIKEAISQFDEEHDAFIIFDSDNLVHPGYLAELDKYFQHGYRAVQTHMLPKNTDTLYAKMDASGNHYCNFVDRLMHMELGVSSCIWGLGIAVETKLYKQILFDGYKKSFENLGGFDKKMQAAMVSSIPLLAYAPAAIVYDEKIQDGSKLQKQRTRWIHAYFASIKDGLQVVWTGIKKFRPGLVFFGVNLLRPPLFMLLGAAGLLMLFNIWYSPVMAFAWLAAILTFVITFFSIVMVMSKDAGIFKAMFHLPFFVLRQVKALLKINDANKGFLRTSNTKVVYIEEVLGAAKD